MSIQTQDQQLSPWSTDPLFESLPALDIEGRGLCLSAAPADDQSWGVEGFLFSADNDVFGANSLDWYRIHNRQEGIYLYGRETQGEWGLVRVIQGDAWNGSQCGTPILWHVPTQVPASAIDRITLDYRLDTANLLTHDASWLMVAINLWLSAPEYTKPLVIDLVVHHQCNNAPDCGLRHFEDDLAFHYMHRVTHLESESVPVIIKDALRAVYRDECQQTTCIGRLPDTMPTLQQFEFVIEVHRSEAAAFVTHLELFTDNT
jgi:hypothetical protein